jgi:tetratricopeptide (TPR) repeat protein
LHDQSFPDEPKQVQPGETISIDPTSGRVQVSGQVAVMMINERLLMTLMQNNPSLSFALEESFPLKGTYADAVPLGPVMQLGVTSQNGLDADAAGQSVAYWQDTTRQLLSDPAASGSSDVLRAYAKMEVGQANVFVNHDLLTQAIETFRLADQLAPDSPEVVFGYVNLLLKQNRFADAMEVAQRAQQLAPDNKQYQALANQLQQKAAGK